MGQELSFGLGDVSDVSQEEFYPPVQGRDLWEGFPEVVKKFEGVKLLPAAATRGDALVMIPGEVCTEGSTVFPSTGGGVSGVLRATTIRADSEPVVDKRCQRVARRVMCSE